MDHPHSNRTSLAHVAAARERAAGRHRRARALAVTAAVALAACTGEIETSVQ